MALPEYSMRQLMEAGVHFGHQTHRWNPKMKSFIYGSRNNIHIMDLSQTVPALHRALSFVRDAVAGGGKVLFVGTKRQAQNPIAEAAKRCGQHYVNKRWLGGMLTNWQTISNSIKKLKELDDQLADLHGGFTKKEILQMTRLRDKLEASLGGIRDMGGVPDVIFVIDTNREEIAINEARVLGIPVIGVLDSNCDPDGITMPIPGNDDASRAIQLYCQLISDAVLDGISAELSARGVDIGAAEDVAKVAEADAKAAEKAAKPAKKADTKADDKAEDKPAEKKAPAKKVAATKTDEKADEKAEAKPAAKKTAAKKAPAKKAPAKKADEKAEKKPAAKKAPAKKAPAKKAADKK